MTLTARGRERDVPPDRPIRDDHAAWLLTLDEDRRRDWWRDVAQRYNGDWLAAERAATEAMKHP